VEKTYFHEEWTTHDSQRGTQHHSITKTGKNVVLKHIVPLCGAGQFEAGSYQWPISFTLPVNLPGTFLYSANPHTGRNTVVRASIEYKVKATLDVPGMFKADIKNKARPRAAAGVGVGVQPPLASPAPRRRRRRRW